MCAQLLGPHCPQVIPPLVSAVIRKNIKVKMQLSAVKPGLHLHLTLKVLNF